MRHYFSINTDCIHYIVFSHKIQHANSVWNKTRPSSSAGNRRWLLQISGTTPGVSHNTRIYIETEKRSFAFIKRNAGHTRWPASDFSKGYCKMRHFAITPLWRNINPFAIVMNALADRKEPAVFFGITDHTHLVTVANRRIKLPCEVAHRRIQ